MARSVDVPLWLPRVGALAMAWAWSIIAFGTGTFFFFISHSSH